MTSTLGAFLRDKADRFANNEALVFEDRRYTYADVLAHAEAVASDLEAGETVAIVMGNRPEAIFTIFGAALAGAVAVPLSTFATRDELKFMLEDCGADLVVTQDRLLGRALANELRMVHPQVATFGVFLGGDKERGDPRPDDAAVIIYSSGTTSTPKGMVHSHAAHVTAFENQARVFRRDETSRVWTAFPLFWTAGFDSAMGATLAAGGCLVLQETFEPGAALALMAREHVDEPYCLPHQTQAMAEHPDWATTDLSSMTKVFGKSAFARHPKVDGDTHWQNPTGYGLSETCAFFAAHSADTPRDVMKKSIGALLPGNELRIADDGELLVKGPTLMQHYVGRKPAGCFDAEGFFHTGDTGHLDEHGHLVFEGRKTEMIKTGGANVSPAEIEVALRAFEPVKLARIVGVPDERLGERVVACIVLKGEATEADVQNFLKDRVAAYKVPRQVLFFADGEIPMTRSDTKVRDAELLALVMERL
ncbi:MAG TPA: class I adenylate-forming enzyme family protein [Acidimicrobiales bacterium]|nr:class I adenylate-forming enzyme family protein [Acidimicrobiales bacterium]